MDITLPTADLDQALQHPLVSGLLETVSDGAVVIDARNRRILAMNTVARDLLGYDDHEVMGCQCKRVMNSPACTLACPLTALLDGAQRQEIDLYYRGQGEGLLLHARTRMLLLREPTGAPLAGIELFQDLRQVRHLERQLNRRRALMGIIGASPAMQSLFDLVEQVAPYDIPVLITGESGVGKERFADAVHALSRRAEGPLVKVNCAALSPGLFESELFGHRRGAFTGAHCERKGRFEEASGGSLLLDEIGELPLALQPKLLRVLQEGESQRVGDDRPRQVDVRILAATNRDLEGDVAAGRFRRDLYYRLMGARLHVPPLRERPEDIPLLAEHVLGRLAEQGQDRATRPIPPRLSDAAVSALIEAPWPGNVRELEACLRLAAIRAAGEPAIEPHHLTQSPQGLRPQTSELPLNLATLEAQAIERAMSHTAGNLSAAARLLGVDRTTLWRKLKRMEKASP